jgi:hypothetical protein
LVGQLGNELRNFVIFKTKNFSKFIEQNKFDEVIFEHEEFKQKWIDDMNYLIFLSKK